MKHLRSVLLLIIGACLVGLVVAEFRSHDPWCTPQANLCVHQKVAGSFGGHAH